MASTSFYGTQDDLLTLVGQIGGKVVTSEEKSGCFDIRTREGAVVKFWPNSAKKTVNVVGNPVAASRIQDALFPAIKQFNDGDEITVPGIANGKTSAPGAENKKIFVVHGHDTQAREQLELVLHKLGLEPFVLANTAGGGLTIIEALENEIGPEEGKTRFGIVLLTPDDIGYAKAVGPDTAEPRARQNVVLEMGMLIAAVKRQNVVILKKGHLEIPSDAHGIIYIGFNEHVKEVVPKLVERLHHSGFVIEASAITRASS